MVSWEHRKRDAAPSEQSRGPKDLRGRVLWCDSDEKVGAEAQVLLGSGLDLDTFQEPEAGGRRAGGRR